MSSTATVTTSWASAIEAQPAVARTIRIHRFSPNLTYIPPRADGRRDTEKRQPTARTHRRLRSNTSPPVPVTHLPAPLAPPRKSEDCQRPTQFREESPCKWRFHSPTSPGLCERNAPAAAPVEVLNVRKLPTANTPWLGSPSWTNFGNAPWDSPQRESQAVFPDCNGPLGSPPPPYHTVTRSQSDPVSTYRGADSPRSPARGATRALLSVNTTNGATASQRSSWASVQSSCPSLIRPRSMCRPATSPSSHTISPISPLAFEHADWPDFGDYSTGIVDEDGLDGVVSPTSTMGNMAWAGLCVSLSDVRPKSSPTEIVRPVMETPTQPAPEGFEGPFLSIVDLPQPRRSASAEMLRSQADGGASTLPQRATTVSYSPGEPRPTRSNTIKRKPVAAHNLKLVVPNRAPAPAPTRHVLPPLDTPGWRHTIAVPTEEPVPAAYPTRPRVQSQMFMADEGDLPTPRLPPSHNAPVPRVTVEEVSHPRLGFGRRPSKQALRLAADEQLRRRTIEPSGIGLDSEQWLDLQLAVMGIPGASWNAGASGPDAPMSASIF